MGRDGAARVGQQISPGARLSRPICTPLAVLACHLGHAATLAATRSEIDGLLKALQQSGCAFHRNGSWFNATEAKAHMLRKLDHLEDKRGGVPSAEAFIEQAATRSSMTGLAYQVRCGTAPAEPSALWMTRTLKQVRHPGS